MQRLFVKAEWTIVFTGGRHVPVRGACLDIIDGSIADVHATPSEGARVIDIPGGIAFPGFVNLHNHTINAPLFRGIVDDLSRSAIGESKVYSMLMPMGGLAVSHLEEDELEALVAIGLLEILKSGATTVLDQFRPCQRSILSLARQWGLRLYGAPYLFSPATTFSDQSVAKASSGSFEGKTGLSAFEKLYEEFDEGEGGRIRVILGPHAADSCGRDLFEHVNRIALERKLLVTTHLAQSQGEVDRVRQQHGCSTAEYMRSVGLMRDGVIFGHGVHLTDDELLMVRDAGASIAHCATVFLRGGKAPHYAHFAQHGVRLGIGTDAERMDMFSQLRATGFASKQATGASQGATASDLLHAATVGGADAIGRRDLGRIAKGARADVVVVDALKPHLQPINDPIRSLVWYASSADVHTVLIDGRVVVHDGQVPGIDTREIVRRGALAARKVWQAARERGYFPAEAEPLEA
jgi:cytosine/adenosine deaminase-related metal-dependent hydrolase